MDAAGAVGAQPDLGGGLLAGDVERARAGTRAVWAATSSSSVLLPTPGSPASRIAAPGHQPAAEHPVELGHAAGAELRLLDRHLADRHGRGRHRATRSRAWSGAAASATEPQAWHSPQRPTHLVGLPAALGAAVGGPDLGGFAHASARVGDGTDSPTDNWVGRPRDGMRGSYAASIGTIKEPAMSRTEPRGSRIHPGRTADARRRRRAGRRLPADGLQRGQQPRPAAPRHPRARARGDRRARLLAQPCGPQPAHPQPRT